MEAVIMKALSKLCGVLNVDTTGRHGVTNFPPSLDLGVKAAGVMEYLKYDDT